MGWTEQSLSSVTKKNGYRLRGESMTRIEVFSDAAFAFAVTRSSLGYLAGIAYSLAPVAIFLVTLRTRRKIRSNLSESSN